MSDPLMPITQLGGRYELHQPLGSGGMARVVAATDRRLNRPVAIKLIRGELVADDAARARLLHEARAAAAFQHPHAVAVFDVGEDPDRRPFIIMERVEGETLARRLARDGPLGAADAIAVGTAVLDALAAAHRRGLVHRDVKPDNVLLPADGGIKLADFGIAKGLQSSAAGLTATGEIVGTPAYLSPEQAEGLAATPRSDVYALGVVLYECLAGRPPFTGQSTVAVATAHQRDPVPPLADRAPATPPALAGVVQRALAKSPDARFAGAAAMRAALGEAGRGLAAAPTIAVPAASVTLGGTGAKEGGTRGGRPSGGGDPAGAASARRRRQRWLAAAAAVALGLVLGLVGTLSAGARPLAPSTSVARCSWTSAAPCATMRSDVEGTVEQPEEPAAELAAEAVRGRGAGP